MELNQIKYFAELARTLNFTRAAEASHVSQPALTRAIQKLEEELGGPLFRRERRHTQLTELGRLILPPLQRALASAHDARMQADAFRRRETSPLRIGLEYSIPSLVLTPVLTALRRRDSDIELTLREGPRAVICEQMLAGELDFALLVEVSDLQERMHRWQMYSERYVLFCPPGHRLAARDAVSAGDIAAECLLMHEDAACPARAFVTEFLEQNHVRPRARHFANSPSQILDMVQASLGVAVEGERLPSAAPLLRRPIAAEPDTRTIILTTVAGRPLGPTAALFLKLMRARAWSLDAPALAAAA